MTNLVLNRQNYTQMSVLIFTKKNNLFDNLIREFNLIK